MKVQLGKLVNVKTGKLDANASSINGAYPFFTCSKEPLKISTYSYDCECVLVAGNGDLNVKYYNGKFDAYQRTYIIEDNGCKKIYIPYLYYFMDKYVEKLRTQSIGGVIKYIKLSNITEVEIVLPNVDIQKKIVDKLDKVNAVINKKNMQLEKLDLLVRSLFIEMFGDPIINTKKWKKEKCKNILTKIGSGATPQGGSESYKEEGISLIRSMNVHNGRFESKDLAYIDEKQAQKLDNVNIKENDVLINITGASVARCCIVPSYVIPARVNQHVSVLRCSDMVNSIFLCYQITNDSYQNLLKKIGTSGGATREAITKKQIEDLEVILPPLELQNKFANFVRGTDKSKYSSFSHLSA